MSLSCNNVRYHSHLQFLLSKPMCCAVGKEYHILIALSEHNCIWLNTIPQGIVSHLAYSKLVALES